MRRGRLDRAAAVLEKIIQYPQRSPSRVFAGEGLNYYFLNDLVSSGLVEVYMHGKQRRLLSTPDGREFLKCYKRCIQLFPN